MHTHDAVAALDAIEKGDNEVAHGIADDVLLSFLRANGHSEVADAWERACDRVGGFWYA